MIILASASPRRRELLQMVGLKFMVSTTNCDESSEETDPEKLTIEIAKRKAQAVRHTEEDVVIGADTLIYLDGKVMGKPRDTDHAKAMLKKLSGKTHSVYTGVCIVKGEMVDTFCVKTDVTFFELVDKFIDIYVASGDSLDKAGAYGIQGKGAMLVEKINGDFYSVMGLPVAMVVRKVRKLVAGQCSGKKCSDEEFLGK